MQIGSHLPQYGGIASPEAIRRAARHAEALGYAGVWASDHVVHPAAQNYPNPRLFDPLLTLTWAAAATSRVGVGTSVLVAAQHNPLWLANALASLDTLSGGRLTVGLGVGWSKAEFEALGQSFHDRGARTDEIIELLRICWRDDPASFAGKYYAFEDVRVLPRPAHPIPLWIGGTSEPAYRRGVRAGDGFQFIGLTAEQAAAAVKRVRDERPEADFTISLRTGWDPRGMEPDRIRREYDVFAAAGIQYVVTAFWRRELGDWLGAMEDLATLLELPPSPAVSAP